MAGAPPLPTGLHDPTGEAAAQAEERRTFKACLYLMDAATKKKPLRLDDDAAIRWYYMRKTTPYKLAVLAACLLYLSVCLLEVPAFGRAYSKRAGQHWYQVPIDMGCVIFFLLDIFARTKAVGTRSVLGNRWTQLFIVLLVVDVFGVVWPVLRVLMVTGIVRCYPIIFYYRKARNATLDYLRALPAVLLWIGFEIFFVVAYACMGVLLYASTDRDGQSRQDAFIDFRHAFLSLYSLSLTVNSPDVYLPYYEINKGNIVLFASFLVFTYFLLHNIILSRIYPIYCVKLRQTAIQRNGYRHECIVLAFEALDHEQQGSLPRELVQRVVRRFRPHYSEGKVLTLMRYAVREDPEQYDLEEFEVLMVSVIEDVIHKVRRGAVYPAALQHAVNALMVAEFVLIVLTIVKYWQGFHTAWFWGIILVVRLLLTADVAYRIRAHGAVKYYLKSYVNLFNLLACLLSLVTLVSLLLALHEDDWSFTLMDDHGPSKKVASAFILLTGTCDVLVVSARIIEFAALFTVFKRLLPAFLGQAVVVFTLMHVFCYVGMYIFGGLVDKSQPMWDESTLNSASHLFPHNLYYLLNFNTYREGMITLFVLLVLNNCNILADNFIKITSGAAYLYFMIFEIAVVTIGLNCVTSFFIGHLSEQLDEELKHQLANRQRLREQQKREQPCCLPLWAKKAAARQGEEDEQGNGGVVDAGAAAGRWWSGGRRQSHGRRGRRQKAKKVVESEQDDEEDMPEVYKMEHELSSGFLMLANEEPVDATEYRSLLEALVAEAGGRTAYCLIKDKLHKAPEVVQKSCAFGKIANPYDGEARILAIVRDVFKRDMARRRAGVPFSPTRTASYLAQVEENASVTPPTTGAGGSCPGTICPSSRPRPRQRGGRRSEDDAYRGGAGSGAGSYFVQHEVLRREEGADATSGRGEEGVMVLAVRIVFLTERECALAYVQVEERLETK